MLLVGYFEGIPSQRRIDWRGADSPSLRKLLAIPLTESTLAHMSMTHIRERMLRLCCANLLPDEPLSPCFSATVNERLGS